MAAATAAGAKRQITQATFDETVRENMEEFDMARAEAVADAVKQFTSQGACGRVASVVVGCRLCITPCFFLPSHRLLSPLISIDRPNPPPPPTHNRTRTPSPRRGPL